jgi:hypothetical protein
VPHSIAGHSQESGAIMCFGDMNFVQYNKIRVRAALAWVSAMGQEFLSCGINANASNKLSPPSTPPTFKDMTLLIVKNVGFGTLVVSAQDIDICATVVTAVYICLRAP